MPGEEKRYAEDGGAYSLVEFISFFGEEEGRVYWNAAAPQKHGNIEAPLQQDVSDAVLPHEDDGNENSQVLACDGEAMQGVGKNAEQGPISNDQSASEDHHDDTKQPRPDASCNHAIQESVHSEVVHHELQARKIDIDKKDGQDAAEMIIPCVQEGASRTDVSIQPQLKEADRTLNLEGQAAPTEESAQTAVARVIEAPTEVSDAAEEPQPAGVLEEAAPGADAEPREDSQPRAEPQAAEPSHEESQPHESPTVAAAPRKDAPSAETAPEKHGAKQAEATRDVCPQQACGEVLESPMGHRDSLESELWQDPATIPCPTCSLRHCQCSSVSEAYPQKADEEQASEAERMERLPAPAATSMGQRLEEVARTIDAKDEEQCQKEVVAEEEEDRRSVWLKEVQERRELSLEEQEQRREKRKTLHAEQVAQQVESLLANFPFDFQASNKVCASDVFKELRKWWRGKCTSERAETAEQLDSTVRHGIFDFLMEFRVFRPMYVRQADEILRDLASIQGWTADRAVEISKVEQLVGEITPTHDVVPTSPKEPNDTVVGESIPAKEAHASSENRSADGREAEQETVAENATESDGSSQSDPDGHGSPAKQGVGHVGSDGHGGEDCRRTDSIEGDDRPRTDSMEAAAPPLAEQFVFFIRHAESRWNMSRGKRNLAGMYGENDHGISERGCEQAEKLCSEISQAAAGKKAAACAAEPEWQTHFLNPGVIFVSPLTRAVETAILALPVFLAKGERELVCMRTARERRNVGGADCTGVVTGDAVGARVQAELHNLYPAHENVVARPTDGERPMLERSPTTMARLEKRTNYLGHLQNVRLNVDEVQEEWWDTAKESDECFSNRLVEFAEQIHNCGQRSVIVVGHSHFFRGFFSAFAPGAASETKKKSRIKSMFKLIRGKSVNKKTLDTSLATCAVTQQLKTHLLPNCGVVGLRLQWASLGDPVIEETVPLFGTDLNFCSSDGGDITPQ